MLCYHRAGLLSRLFLLLCRGITATPTVTPPAAQREPLPACFGRARALPLRGRGTRWRRYRVTKRGNCLRNNTLDYSKARWSTLYHSKACSSKRVFFYFEVVLLITCSVSYSNALTCFTDLGIVYHLGRPALRTVLTSSCPPSGRCSIAIQER